MKTYPSKPLHTSDILVYSLHNHHFRESWALAQCKSNPRGVWGGVLIGTVGWNMYLTSRENAIMSIIKLITKYNAHNISAERLYA